MPNPVKFYPFAYTLFDEELDSHCWYCLTAVTDENKLKRCAGCNVAFFCGKTCQVLGWPDHKVECKSLKKAEQIPSIEVRMLGRVMIRHKQIESGESEKIKDFYLNRTSRRSIMDLWSHSDDMRKDPSAAKKFAQIYTQLVFFYGAKNMLEQEVVFQLHCRNFINRHGICDSLYIKEIGKGLYLDLCEYNHSCAPNAVYSHDGFVATLRAIAGGIADLGDITKVTYTYVDLMNCRQQRRKMLKDDWYFDCECSKCTDDETDNMLTAMKCESCAGTINIFGGTAKEDFLCPHCKTPFSPTRIGEALTAMRDIDQILENETVMNASIEGSRKLVVNLIEKYQSLLHEKNVYMLRLLQAIINRLSSDEHELNLKYHLSAAESLKLCFPENHPAMAYHWMNMGIFYTTLKMPNNARRFLNDAIVILSKSLGPQHRMTFRAKGLVAAVDVED